jgi:signal transduction histidine kinase
VHALRHSTRWTLERSFDLTAGILFSAAVLRASIAYSSSPLRVYILLVLAAMFALYTLERFSPLHSTAIFSAYLAVQSTLITFLLFAPGEPDYFALLYAILSMQILQKLPLKIGIFPIIAFTPLMYAPLKQMYDPSSKAVAFTLVYSAVSAFMAAYSLALRRAYIARERAQNLGEELQQANRELQTTAQRVERMAVAKERNRLARELHDSVTQTVFSMTLTIESARMQSKLDPERVANELDRLYQLSRSAISEMQELIAKLSPLADRDESLVEAVQHHLTQGHLPDDLQVCLEVDGGDTLPTKQAQAIFRIVQEALNNVVKHAQSDQVFIHLHLIAPYFIEVEDQGRGFDPDRVSHQGGIGLSGMSERAEEIGWELTISSTPGVGTRVRAEDKRRGGR